MPVSQRTQGRNDTHTIAVAQVLDNNRNELQKAEAEVVAAYEGSSIVVEAEVVRYLAVLRMNVGRLERMLGDTDAPAAP